MTNFRNTIQQFQAQGISSDILRMSLLLIFFMLVIEYLHKRFNLLGVLNKQPLFVRWTIYYIALICIALFGIFENRQFVYFQF
jgi:alginate O-acetyltransferase complex protein AlgI